MIFKISKGIEIASAVQNLWQFYWRGEFTYQWSCIGKGLRLQPAQQACFLDLGSSIKLDGVGPVDNRPSTD